MSEKQKPLKGLDMDDILYGEKRPGILGLLGQSFLAVLKYLFKPEKLTVRDARRLKGVHEKTNISFPIKSERFNKKKINTLSSFFLIDLDFIN